ncbi:MAG: hypothetical protein K0Q55_3031 [Verrucomicrobia bacterium]|jgi:hypothetical protein|nr:hypothetical protein [Verrucomicrobiota bacterium]
MKAFWTLCLGLLAFTAFATSVPPRSLAQLVADSDHIIIGKITLVDMVDAKGRQVTNLPTRTGPGLPNTIRLNVTVQTNGVLLTNSKQVPPTLTIPLDSVWHYSLGQIKDAEEGQTRILLLKGPDFGFAYMNGCSRPLSERSEIEELLKTKGTKPSSPPPPAPKPKS